MGQQMLYCDLKRAREREREHERERERAREREREHERERARERDREREREVGKQQLQQKNHFTNTSTIWGPTIFVFKRTIPGLFICIFVLSIQFTVNICLI